MPRDEVRHANGGTGGLRRDLDRLTLAGGVEMTDAGSVLWANQVALDLGTRDAHALGRVKVDYVEDSAKTNAGQRNTGPTHILADRAELEHATDIATFYGKPVRLWESGGSQVQAPEIELSRQQKRLIARGVGSTGWSAAAQAAQVHTVLVSGAGDRGSGAGFRGGQECDGAVCGRHRRNGSRRSQGRCGRRDAGGGAHCQRRADLLGHSASGRLYRRSAGGDGGRNHPGEPGHGLSGADARERDGQRAGGCTFAWGSLERMVAAGHVAIDRPGLQATGERLVYTARDQVFLLTGDPKAVDAQGTTTGAALRMHNTCDASGGVSVEALGEIPGEPAQGVHTESRVQDERKKEMGRK